MKSHIKQLGILCIIFLIFSCAKSEDDQVLPTITGMTPISGQKMTIVTINGSNFSSANTTQVFFNEMEAVVQSVTETEIKAMVSVKFVTGLVKVISNGKLMVPKFTYLMTTIEVSTLAGSTEGFSEGTGINAQFLHQIELR